MICSRFASFVFAVSCAFYDVGALELSSENFDEQVEGKAVFVKFFAPWCGHCKKIKPDWARLMDDFAGSPDSLVAEVDCTGKGKPVCEKYDVKGYPQLRWGNGSKLEIYQGMRTYEAFKTFAETHLGKSCGPGDLELCDQNRSARFQKFMRMSPESLDKSLDTADKQIKRLEASFKATEQEMGRQIQVEMQRRDKKIKSIKEKQGLPQGPAHGALELTSTNWEKKVAGKTVFVKFFAPWCGHCKAIKHDWERLMTDYEGTLTALVAEADCAGKGKELCEDKGVTGYPRLMWGYPQDELSVYSGGRSYDELKMFAEDHLGKNCGPSNLELCDKKQKASMDGLANMSPEKREETGKVVEKAIKKAEKRWDDAQWNLTLQIDLAEQEKDNAVKAVQEQGLAEAKQVQAWNKKQPEGFWKPPPKPRPPPSPWDFMDDVAVEVGGFKVAKKIELVGLVLAVAAAFLLSKMLPGSPVKEKMCTARHILLKSEDDILKVKTRLDAGEDFDKLAKECSMCPSAKDGGSLGTRPEGSMSQAMGKVCFDPATEIGKPYGPIKTSFGFHMVVVDNRTGVAELPSETRKDK